MSFHLILIPGDLCGLGVFFYFLISPAIYFKVFLAFFPFIVAFKNTILHKPRTILSIKGFHASFILNLLMYIGPLSVYKQTLKFTQI